MARVEEFSVHRALILLRFWKIEEARLIKRDDLPSALESLKKLIAGQKEIERPAEKAKKDIESLTHKKRAMGTMNFIKEREKNLR
jgi:hypothetical protein